MYASELKMLLVSSLLFAVFVPVFGNPDTQHYWVLLKMSRVSGQIV